jgi:hypothetical protein
MGDVFQGIKLEFLPYEHQLAYQILLREMDYKELNATVTYTVYHLSVH